VILLLLLAAATPQAETAVDAERAFNRAAQTDGQWTAFRRFAVANAIIFTPQPVKAQQVLPTRNPPIAVQWWPAESYASCDGTMAVNTGPWMRPKSVGYFTTVWARQRDGHFKWEMDGGDELAVARRLPERPRVRRASCKGTAHMVLEVPGGGATLGQGESDDHTLQYYWRVATDGSRRFSASLWNGRSFVEVLHNEIAAPK
jgi:hypothetical protein